MTPVLSVDWRTRQLAAGKRKKSKQLSAERETGIVDVEGQAEEEVGTQDGIF